MINFVAQGRLRKVFWERLPSPAKLEVGPGTHVMVFREHFQK